MTRRTRSQECPRRSRTRKRQLPQATPRQANAETASTTAPPAVTVDHAGVDHHQGAAHLGQQERDRSQQRPRPGWAEQQLRGPPGSSTPGRCTKCQWLEGRTSVRASRPAGPNDATSLMSATAGARKKTVKPHDDRHCAGGIPHPGRRIAALVAEGVDDVETRQREEQRDETEPCGDSAHEPTAA